MISASLKQAKSVEEVVQLIDKGGTDNHSPEEVAGQYGYLVLLHKKKVDKDAVKEQLNILLENGAVFDFDLALQHAETLLIDLVQS